MKRKRIKQRALAGVLGKSLTRRSRGQCELCSSREGVRVYEVPPFPPDPDIERALMGCERCREWLERGGIIPVQAYFLESAIWSEHLAVRLAAARMLIEVDGMEVPWVRDALEAVGVDPSTGELVV